MATKPTAHDLVPVVAAFAHARAGLQRPVLVAFDGRSGVGKSTLARGLAESLGGRHIIADDFWCGGSDDAWATRTPAQRTADCIDWRRLRADVLEPLMAGRPARWRPFDWEAGDGLSTRTLECEPAPVIVLDGAYSARPELADLVDVTVLVTLDDDVRRTRLPAREGASYMRRWHELWDAAEEYYFGHVRPPEAFDVVLTSS